MCFYYELRFVHREKAKKEIIAGNRSPGSLNVFSPAPYRFRSGRSRIPPGGRSAGLAGRGTDFLPPRLPQRRWKNEGEPRARRSGTVGHCLPRKGSSREQGLEDVVLLFQFRR